LIEANTAAGDVAPLFEMKEAANFGGLDTMP